MNIADCLLILNVEVYAPDIGEETPHGTHGKMVEKPGRPNISGILRAEFREPRGSILVSGKCLGPNRGND